jgi:uncharacterized protein
MTDKRVAVTVIGFMAQGVIAVMGGLGDVGVISPGGGLAAGANIGLGCLVLSACAVLCFFYGRTIDTLIFAGGAAFELTMHFFGGKDSPATAGWFFLLWTTFFFYLWLSSLKSGWARSLYLFAVCLCVLDFCLLYWTQRRFFLVINGCSGLVVGVTAFYISAAEVLNHSWGRLVLPGGAGEIAGAKEIAPFTAS